MTLLDNLIHAGVSIERAAASERHLRDYTVCGEPPLAVAYPRSTDEISTLLRLCNAANQAVVPQGGMTGMAGGGVPSKGAIVVSVERLRGVEEVDRAGATMTVRSGTPLQTVQEAAGEVGLMFPLDLGARGSCHIGGLVSTNAGGNRVLRYGMMRDLVLGLEAVLPDGTVVSSLNKMQKNNTGYDTKQLFIGSEGTLGIVTRVVLRLFPQPKSSCTALCAADTYDQVVELLARTKADLGGTLSAFEVMWPAFYALATQQRPRGAPLPHGHGLYVLLDALGSDQQADQARFEAIIASAVEDGVVVDAVVAQSEADSKSLWDIRDATGEFPQMFWPHIAFDVSFPVGEIAAFVAYCDKRIMKSWPAAEVLYFGHIADCNIHVAVKLADGLSSAADVKKLVYGAVRECGGSISAEHGIGLEKRDYLPYSRSQAELGLMRLLKRSLDPNGILNPGKVLAP